MMMRHLTKVGVLTLLVGASSACATATPNAFDRHDSFDARRVVQERSVDRDVCPVVVSNATGFLVDAVYTESGVESTLGRIPSGRSVAFRVECDSGQIETHAISEVGGLLGGGLEYRKIARLDRTGETVVSLNVTDRIR